MRVLLILLLTLANLVPEAGPARAQATADQLNKLSLEALTTPAPGGNPGPSYGSHRSYASHRSYRKTASGRGGYRRSGRGSYHRARYAGYAPPSRRPTAYHHRARRHDAGRAAGAYRSNPYVPDFYRPRRR